MDHEYEKLALLLYPSIEASGNVYYGQTRKLALDELFNKNDFGFESWIDLSSDYDNKENQNDTDLKKCLCWKLGPFKGKINIEPNLSDTYSDHFATYKIVLKDVTNENNLDSGRFESYHTDTSIDYQSIIGTNSANPTDLYKQLDNDITFTVDYENKLLYIRLVHLDENDELLDYTKNDYSNFKNDPNEPLTLTCIESGYVSLHLPFAVKESGDHFNTYEYSLNGNTWTHWEISDSGFHPDVLAPDSESYYGEAIEWADLKPIQMSAGDVLKVRCYGEFALNNYPQYHATGSTHFLLSGKYNLSGNAFSMTRGSDCGTVSEAKPYELFHLFSRYGAYGIDSADHSQSHENDRTNIDWESGVVDASRLLLPAATLADSCYRCMFYKCDTLEVAPKLPATTLGISCYTSMFNECTSLKLPPALPASNFTSNCKYCYSYMFYGCTSLQATHCFIGRSFGEDQDSDDNLSGSDFITQMYGECQNIIVYTTVDLRDYIVGLGDENIKEVYNSGYADGLSVSQEKVHLVTESELESLAKEAGVISRSNYLNTAKICIGRKDHLTTYGFTHSCDNIENHSNGKFEHGGLSQTVYGCKQFMSPVSFESSIYTDTLYCKYIYSSKYQHSEPYGSGYRQILLNAFTSEDTHDNESSRYDVSIGEIVCVILKRCSANSGNNYTQDGVTAERYNIFTYNKANGVFLKQGDPDNEYMLFHSDLSGTKSYDSVKKWTYDTSIEEYQFEVLTFGNPCLVVRIR